MTTTATEGTDRLNTSANNAAASTNRLTTAINKAGSAFGGIIRGAPQTLGDFTEGLTKLIGTGGPVNEAMKFAEGYVGVWQELSRSGFNFNNQLDRLVISAGAANMRLEDLGRTVQASGETIAGMGLTANQGLANFLARQGSFFRDQERQFEGVQRRLLGLGLTTQDINERFLQFDSIQTIRNRRLSLSEEERINQATGFAESMDRLSKLTGQQADRLAAEAVQLERQGNIYARAQQLPAETADIFRDTIQELGKQGAGFGSLATDILTRGFIDPNDPAVLMLNSFAPELVETLYAARAAQQRGDVQEATRLRDIASQQAAAVRRNEDFLNQAVLGSANEYTRAAQGVITEMNSSGISLRLNEVETAFSSSMGRAATSAEELATYLNGVLEQEKRLQLEGVDSQQIIRAYNEALIGLQAISRTVQERTVTGFANMGTAVSDTIIRAVRSTDVRSMTDSVLAELTGAIDWWTGRDTDLVGRIQERQRALATLAERTTDEAAAANLLDYSRQIGAVAAELTGPNPISSEEARNRLYQLEQGAREIRTPEMTVHANNVNLSPALNNSIREAAAADAARRSGTPVTGQSIGTFGRTGGFFDNFGPGTTVELHGIEGVFRPNHIEDIMERSSRGTINELVKQITSRGFGNDQSVSTLVNSVRNVTSSIDGRLNTIRANISRDMRQTQTFNPEMIADQIGLALGRMPDDMRRAFEEALGSTIQQPMEQLVTVSTRGVDYQERVYKNTRGMTTDYLRGA